MWLMVSIKSEFNEADGACDSVANESHRDEKHDLSWLYFEHMNNFTTMEN